MIELEVNLTHYLILGAMLFVIGLSGIFVAKRNVITVLMSVELMLLSVNINFVAFSSYVDDLVGQVFSLFILTIAAAEAAIGVAIVLLYFRNHNSLELKNISTMKG